MYLMYVFLFKAITFSFKAIEFFDYCNFYCPTLAKIVLRKNAAQTHNHHVYASKKTQNKRSSKE